MKLIFSGRREDVVQRNRQSFLEFNIIRQWGHSLLVAQRKRMYCANNLQMTANKRAVLRAILKHCKFSITLWYIIITAVQQHCKLAVQIYIIIIKHCNTCIYVGIANVAAQWIVKWKLVTFRITSKHRSNPVYHFQRCFSLIGAVVTISASFSAHCLWVSLSNFKLYHVLMKIERLCFSCSAWGNDPPCLFPQLQTKRNRLIGQKPCRGTCVVQTAC